LFLDILMWDNYILYLLMPFEMSYLQLFLSYA